jgi:ribonuclease P protein component
MATLDRLKQRRDFQRLNAHGRKFVTRSMVMLIMNQTPLLPEPTCRLGFTTTRKLGNAVMRNRIRRRLREAARVVFSAQGKQGHDYVIIARPAALDRPFNELQGDMRFALKHLHRESSAI